MRYGIKHMTYKYKHVYKILLLARMSDFVVTILAGFIVFTSFSRVTSRYIPKDPAYGKWAVPMRLN